MPRPKKPGAPEPKRRSRTGCWPCKNRKVKCGEERPTCVNCQRAGDTCDYSIRLNWDGRRGKKTDSDSGQDSFPSSPASSASFKLIQQYQPPSSAQAPAAPTSNPQQPSTASRNNPPSRPTSNPASPLSTATSFSELSFQRPSKKRKVDAGVDNVDSTNSPPDKPFAAGQQSDLQPTASSSYSDDASRNPKSDKLDYGSPDSRRLSVNSLLSGHGPGPQPEETYPFPSPKPAVQVDPQPPTTYYGIDRGFKDLDLGKNDDAAAISGTSPTLSRANTLIEAEISSAQSEFGFGVQSGDSGQGTGGYYDKPVPIRIPRSLEPLPSKLLENPMNLLYFHHFLNHTARVLVPYDDPHANPFRFVLPRMAVKNDNLLSALLAYSASHRARLLRQPDPVLRIATWVEDIFPTLRQALVSPEKSFSNANLATAILLASIEIISPTVFGYNISWQRHLDMVRQVITSRPRGLHGVLENFRQDQILSFLWSWAAYLDVIGSLSGGRRDVNSSTGWMFEYELEDIMDGYDEIDCIMGFTTRCVYILAKIAELARKCDAERIGPDQKVIEEWQPSQETVEQGLKLAADLRSSLAQPTRPCKHIHTIGDLEKWDRFELTATNEAFHWAGLVHVYRRILGRSSEDPDLQEAVKMIWEATTKVNRGSSAETCLLFPLFTAGCDTEDPVKRKDVLGRFIAIESTGMTQVHSARRLMQMVWDTGQPWETLLSTEFLG